MNDNLVTPHSLDDVIEVLTDTTSYNSGRVIELVWAASKHTPDKKEECLRLAAHYLGRELDKCYIESTEEKEWDEEPDPAPPAKSPYVEGKCVSCNNHTRVNGKTRICEICEAKTDPRDFIYPKDLP